MDMEELFSWPKQQTMDYLGHRSEVEYEQEWQKQKDGYSSYNRRFILFLMKIKTSEEIIGRCGLHNWNLAEHRAELGCIINPPEFRRMGYATEAVNEVIRYGFQDLNLNRIEAIALADNEASIQALKKFRFTQEGLLREHRFKDGVYEDSLMFSLLASEYSG